MRILAALALLILGVAFSQERSAVQVAAEQMERGEIADAAATLERELASNHAAPPGAYLMLVDCHMRLGALDEAIQTLDQGLRVHPESPPLLKAAGRLLLRSRKWSAKAREPLERALEFSPDDPELHYYLSQWGCLHNQEQICLTEAEKTLEMAPGNTAAALQLNTLIGVAATKLGQLEKAEQAFQRALEINRKAGLKDPAAAYRYVDFLNRQARSDEAVTLAEEIAAKAPNFGPAHLERAKALQKQGNPAEAIELARKSLDLDGMEKENLRAAHMLLARCYFLAGNEEAAARHQKWIEENPH